MRTTIAAFAVILATLLLATSPTPIDARKPRPPKKWLIRSAERSPSSNADSTRFNYGDYEYEYDNGDEDYSYDYDYPDWPTIKPTPPPPPPPPYRPGGLRPTSPTCKLYSYKRYVRVRNMAELLRAGQAARAGDMIELMPGSYFWGNPGKNPEANPSKGWGGGGGSSGGSNTGGGGGFKLQAVLLNKHGTPSRMITICGHRTAIVDGADQVRWKAAAMRIVSSSYIRVAGITLQRALKGIDIQNTTRSQFVSLRTRKTLQEGIRLRFNSKYNVVKGCHVSDTGLLWPGVGEGIYVGTAIGNSITKGLPEDKTDYNTLDGNRFGPNVLADCIDIKEYTTGGTIKNNVFDGRAIKGINGATSWVVVKGNRYTITNNTGSGIVAGGSGFRMAVRVPGWGHRGRFTQNRCTKIDKGRFCIHLDPSSKGNVISCTNTPGSTRTKLCNCAVNTRCAAAAAKKKTASGGRSSALGAGVGGKTAGVKVPGISASSWLDDQKQKYRWD